MTVYHAGCEPNCMNFTGNPDTTAGKFDSNYARCSMYLTSNNGGNLETSSLVGDNSATGYWLHCRWFSPTDSPNNFTTTERNLWDQVMIAVYDALGGNLSMILYANDGTYGNMNARLYSYDSGTYTDGSQWQYYANSAIDIDIHCYTSGADSRLEVYMDNTLVWDITRAGDANNGLKYVVFQSPYQVASGDKSSYMSEIIVADTDTRGWRVKTLPPTGDSATNTAWTGSYTDVDEIVPDDSGAYSTALNQLETYTMGTIGAGQGLVAVAVGTLIAGNGTNDVQAVIRKGGTDYVSANLGLTTGKLPYCSVWNTDPTDSQPWDAGETLTGVEFGVKSVT